MTVLHFLILIGLTLNLFGFLLQTSINKKRSVTGIVLVFVLAQTVFFVAGFGLMQWLDNFFDGYNNVLFRSLIIFTGIKRLVQFYNKRKSGNSYRVDHLLDAVFLGVALSMDALIIGLAYGIKQVALSWLVIWVILFTSLFGLTGMAFKNKLKPKTGKIIDLVSGLLLIILGILVW